jgi:hypothetical protein
MGSILDRLTDRVSKDWHVIMNAKSSFGFVAILVVGATTFATWKAAGTFYEERIATKDSIIATKDANIKYLESQIGPREKTEPTVEQSSRFEVTYQYTNPNATTPLAINIFLTNKGILAAYTPIHSHLAIFTDKVLSAADLNNWFAQLISAAISSRDQFHVESQVYANGPPTYFTIFNALDEKLQPVAIDEAKFKSITDGNMRLYMFVFLQYKDKSTPDKKWRTTEACTFLYKPGAMGVCDTHNSVGLID